MKTIQLETEGYQPPKSGLVLLQCLVGLLFFTFVIRFWYLQIHRGADFAQQAQANHLRQESVYASRGLIRDVKGTLLAENRPAFGLALIREDCKDISATLAQVSEWAGIPLEQLTNRFQQDRRKVKPFEPILLLNDMPFDQVARIEAQLMHWPGLEIVTRSKRYYPEGKEFAHILGYVAEANEQELAADPYLALGDTVGKQGLEYAELRRVAEAMKVLAAKPGIYGMLGGQAVDVKQNGQKVPAETLKFIYEMKTSALMECSLMIGAILAGADQKAVADMGTAARYAGFAFQIQDDILDVTSSLEVLGKKTHSDEKNDKTTYVTLFGLDGAKAYVEKLSYKAIELLEMQKGDSSFLKALLEWLIRREK